MTSPSEPRVKIVRGGTIKVYGLTQGEAQQIKESLRLPNPTYYMQVKRFPNAKHYLSPYVPYYEESKQMPGQPRYLCLPSGVYERLIRFITGRGVTFDVQDVRSSRPHRFGDPQGALRPYQLGIPEALSAHENGYARMDTGFGKTHIAIRLIGLLQQRALVIVPTKNILTQFYDAAESIFPGQASVFDSKRLPESPIVITTIQTLTRRLHSGELTGNEFGTVVVDECHLFTSKQRRSTLGKINGRNLFGFTATDRRTDQQGPAIVFIFGPKRLDEVLPRSLPVVHLRKTTRQYEAIDYPELVDCQTKDVARNKEIASIVKDQLAQGKKILILTKRINHYGFISQHLDKESTFCFDSKFTTKKRKDFLQELKSKQEAFALLGTFSLLSTGFDLPSLDTLIIAGDLKSDVLTQQSVGRILRLFEGKKDPLIIDIQDQGNAIFRRQARARAVFYQEQGWLANGTNPIQFS